MPTLLNIQSSRRYDTSVSRILSNQFIEQWQKSNPGGKVITRDLAKTELPFISLTWISAAFIPNEKRTPEMVEALKLSDELVAEFISADQLLMGVPMHNFNVTADFKAYIDQVVRFNHTYNMDGGMLADKPTTAIIASGRFYTPDSPEQQCNHVSGFLKCVLGYMGIKSVQFVLAGGARAVNLGQETLDNHIKKYQSAIIAAADHQQHL